MATSDLMAQLISFAAGMPALSFSKELLTREIRRTQSALAGNYPAQPSSLMANIPMPVYHLAYSAFLDSLTVTMNGSQAELEVVMRATVHPRHRVGDVIREYEVRTSAPIVIKLEYSSSDRRLQWRQQGYDVPVVTPSWGPDYLNVLSSTNLPDPKEDSYLKEVEVPILWSTGNAFISLVVASLPNYDLGSMCHWLTLIEPARIDYGASHVVITASRAKIDIGGCTSTSIFVEPDPAFPYGNTIEIPSVSSAAEISVYLPKTRLVDFSAGSVQPALLVNTGERGGLVKWQAAGSFGIKSFAVDVSGGIASGNPFTNDFMVSGVFEIASAIDFLGIARAWVNGPSGIKIGLASADIIGSGNLRADIECTFNVPSGVFAAQLVVRDIAINTSIDVNALGWPLDEIADAVLEHVAEKEVKKLSGHVAKLGQWDLLELPDWFTEFLEPEALPFPIIEGHEGVAGIFAIAAMRG